MISLLRVVITESTNQVILELLMIIYALIINLLVKNLVFKLITWCMYGKLILKKKGLKLILLCTLWLRKRHPQEALHVVFFTHFKI